jgi:hypothetical protein
VRCGRTHAQRTTDHKSAPKCFFDFHKTLLSFCSLSHVIGRKADARIDCRFLVPAQATEIRRLKITHKSESHAINPQQN